LPSTSATIVLSSGESDDERENKQDSTAEEAERQYLLQATVDHLIRAFSGKLFGFPTEAKTDRMFPENLLWVGFFPRIFRKKLVLIKTI